MDVLPGSYLMNEALPIELAEPVPDKALVVVETRPMFFLPFVVASAVRTHPGWRLYVFGTPAVHGLLRSQCKNYDLAVTFTLSGPLPPSSYSKLLLSKDFWQAIREEHVLVFQADCALVRPTPLEAMQYDYIGAVSGILDPAQFVMNGGLSLRRRSAMLRAIGELDGRPDLREEPEDMAFCELMRHGGYRLPSMRACDEYAIESQGDPDKAIGMHGTDKHYAPPTLVARLLGFTRPQTGPTQI